MPRIKDEATFKPLGRRRFRCNRCGAKDIKSSRLQAHRNSNCVARAKNSYLTALEIDRVPKEVKIVPIAIEISAGTFKCPHCFERTWISAVGTHNCFSCDKKFEIPKPS